MSENTHFYPEIDANPDFPAIEEKILAFWEREHLFEQSVNARPARVDGHSNEFIFYDGPPFANGLPHYGHLLTGFVKDLFARYETMKGKRVERRFGWDCHGLPAEMGAEKELGISGRQAIMQYGIDKFNEQCRVSVMKYAGEWRAYVKRQGRWVDFDGDYKTMDITFMESVLWAFKQLYDKGLVYEAYRVMPYSWAAETPLSNFETKLDNSYREREDKAVTVAFELKERPKGAPAADKYFVLAWTTTPWTLPSNLALAVNKEISYGWRIVNDTCYIASAHAAVLKELAKPHGKDIIAETERLIIRLMTQDDAQAQLDALFANPLTLPEWPDDFRTLEYSKKAITELEAHQKKHGYSIYGVFDKRTSEMLGRTGCMLRQSDPAYPPYMDLSYAFRKEAQGKGYATEAVKAVIAWLFDHYGAEKIETFIVDGTPGSARVLEKTGFKEVRHFEYKKRPATHFEMTKEQYIAATTLSGDALIGLSYTPLFPYFANRAKSENILETTRLYARPFHADDLDALYTLHASPEIGNSTIDGVQTREQAAADLAHFIEHQRHYRYSQWAIFEKGTDAFVGRGGLIFRAFDVSAEPQVELRYALHKAFWGKGYATELARAIVQWGFRELGVARIVAGSNPDNHVSHRVLEKIGMHYVKNVVYRDKECVYYAIASTDITADDTATPQQGAFRILDGSSFVTDSDGTGIVHMAPGFGEEDQKCCEANGIEIVVPVDGQGKYTDAIYDIAFPPGPPQAGGIKNSPPPPAWEVKNSSPPPAWEVKNSSPPLAWEVKNLSPPLAGGQGGDLSASSAPKGYFGIQPDTTRNRQNMPHAKAMRTPMTDAEWKLWQCVSTKQLEGYKFRRQQTIGQYIVDFVCMSERLIVEIDGGQHAEQQAGYDAARSHFLEKAGYRVIRFWNNEVLQNVEGACEAILSALREGSPPAPPQAGGLGEGVLHLHGLNVIAEPGGSKFGLANDRIIDYLKKSGALIKQETIKHNYPHCWRTDTPLIYRAMPSWYIEVTRFRERAVELNQHINWIPAHVRDGQMGHMLATAPDWSISRNRFWGTPIPIWKSKSGKIKVFGSIQELEAASGQIITDLHRPAIDDIIIHENGEEFRRVEDVFDCWFESGSMPFAQVHYPFENKEWFEQHFPADFITEYVGQTRGWFNTLIMLAAGIFDKAPFKNCICHGVVLDAETGLKYSKRLKNYKDPLEVINQFGADALRWLMIASPVMRGQDLMVDPEGKFIRDVVRLAIKPIWNAYNFFCLYANADGVQASFTTDAAHVMDHYILAKCAASVNAIGSALDAYDTPGATEAVSQFFEALNNWYIRRNKERFWKTEKDADKQAAYDTLYTVLTTLCQAAAPLLPMTLEEIYRGLTLPPLPLGEGRGEGLTTKQNPKTDPEFLTKARDLRNNQTDAENLLWQKLRNRQTAQAKFKRQQPIGQYIADFCCHEANLIVELDGGQHAQQQDYDQQRETYLASQGYKVLRFWNHDVLQNIDGVLQVIYDYLVSVPVESPSPQPSPEGRGSSSVSVHLADFPDISAFPYDPALTERMDWTRDVCNAALAIRNKSNIRVRQPLQTLTIVGDGQPLDAQFEAIIRDEINVKHITYAPMRYDIARFTLKLDFKKLGQRLPDKVKAIIPAAKKPELTSWKLEHHYFYPYEDAPGGGEVLEAGARITEPGWLYSEEYNELHVAPQGWRVEDDAPPTAIGDLILLHEDEYDIKLDIREDLSASAQPLASNDALVILDLTITPELHAEGIARDLVRLIQQARKDAVLNVSDRIRLHVEAPASIQKAVSIHRDYIMEQTLTSELSTRPPAHLLFSTNGSIDGETVTVSLALAG